MNEQGAEEPVVAAVEVPPEVAAAPAASADPVKAPYPFSVLRVLSTALRVTKANFVPFLVVACVLEAPSLLIQLAVGPDDGGQALSALLGMFTRALATSVVVYGVIMELQGSRPSTKACIAEGFRHMGRVLGVSIVSTIAIGLAMLLLIVPGVILGLMYFVIVPVTVVEKLGIDAAMKRSGELTRGRKGDLFLIAALGMGLAMVFAYVAVSELGPQGAIVLNSAASVFMTMFFSVVTAVTYVELRHLREGTQVPELATAFARIRK
jgi:hypothetical protein